MLRAEEQTGDSPCPVAGPRHPPDPLLSGKVPTAPALRPQCCEVGQSSVLPWEGTRLSPARWPTQVGGLSCRAQPAAQSLPPQGPQPQHCSSRDSPEPKQAKLDPGCLTQTLCLTWHHPRLASPSPGVTLARCHPRPAHRNSTITLSPP